MTQSIFERRSWPWVEMMLAWLALGAATQAFVSWAGGQISWDFLNHHVYLGRQWLEGQRLTHDVLAAGSMVCQNPIGYAPLVWMMDAGWSGDTIFFVQTAFYSLLAPASWLMAWALVPGRDGVSAATRLCLVLLACTGSVHWRLMTQTSNDLSATTLAFASLALLAITVEQKRWQRKPIGRLCCMALSGALLALACLVKLSMVFAVIAALTMLLFVEGSWRQKLMLWTVFALAGVLMVILAGGWLITSWRYCGSPIHPFGVNWFSTHMPW